MSQYYFTPDGLLVMTEAAHLARGHCCGRRCRHCPFEYEGVVGYPGVTAPVSVRRARAEDAADIALIGRQTFASSFAKFQADVAANLVPYLDTTFAEDKIAASLLKAANAYWVAEDAAGVIWGFVKLKTSPDPSGVRRGLQLQKVYLRRQARGLGLGSRLLDAAEAFAKTQGATHVWLSTFSGDTPARGFYAPRGYVEVDAFDYRMGTQAFRLLVLERTL